MRILSGDHRKHPGHDDRQNTFDVFRVTEYPCRVIRSFKDRETEALFHDLPVPRVRAFERQAGRKLLYLHRARVLQDLRVPPGNRLEALEGDRQRQRSIRINERWRICFRWEEGNAYDVEIADYH